MADLKQLETALRNADAAGDAQAAQMLAAEIRKMRQPPVSRGASGSWEQELRLPSQAAAGEVAANLATSAIAAPVAGIAGLVSAPFVGSDRAADIIRNTQSALTYEPRSANAQKALDIVSWPFQKFAEGADAAGGYVAEKSGSPALGAAVNTTLQAAPAVLGRGRVGRDRSTTDTRGPVASGEAKAPVQAAAKGERAAGLGRVPEKAPSLDELRDLKDAAYKRADESGITVSDNSLKGLKVRIVSEMRKGGIDPDLHPDATAALRRITSTEGGLTLSKVETLRKIASDAAGSIKPADRRLAGKIVEQIDDYLDNLTERDVVTGNPQQAAALREALGYYSRLKKAETINELFRRAELSAPNFSGSGMENALRTEFRNLAKNKREMRRFTAEERAAIEKVAKGGPMENLLRQVGKLAPTGIVSAGMGSMAGAFIGGPIGAAAVPAVGFASRSAATKLTRRNANAAEELMRRGPPPKAKRPVTATVE